jgi:hypothetical protein
VAATWILVTKLAADGPLTFAVFGDDTFTIKDDRITCMGSNWDGLSLLTHLGYRVQIERPSQAAAG